MNNEMARTSAREGLKLESQVEEEWRQKGWDVEHITKPTVIGPDGRGIKPDFIARKDNTNKVVEVKSNGPVKGTLHEKWSLAVQKFTMQANC